MIDTQENKMSMYRATEKVLDNNNMIWAGWVAFSDAKAAFSTKITGIQTASQQQDAIITGISLDKKTLKIALVDLASSVGGKVVGYAAVVNNLELLNAVNFTHTQLLNMRDELLGQRCQNIHDKANANLAALADYDVTGPILSTLQTAINVYTAKTPEPRAAKAAKKAVTIQLKQLFKDTDVILKLRLDKFMVTYQSSESMFFNAYKTARKIIDLGSTTTKIKVVVKNENGDLITGAAVTLLENGFPAYTKASSAKGIVSIKKVKPGTYDLRIEKEGYNQFTETGIVFQAGKELQRIVTMHTPGETLVLESDVAGLAIANLPLEGVHATDLSMIIIEVTGGTLRFYTANSTTDPPGSVFFDKSSGTVTMTLIEFVELLQLNPETNVLNVQNLGGSPSHYKVTFTNMEQ